MSKSCMELIRDEKWNELNGLIQKDPHLARKVDQQGMLALHRVCQHKNVPLKVINLLLNAYPQSAKVRNADGDLPVTIAAECKCLHDVICILISANPTHQQRLSLNMDKISNPDQHSVTYLPTKSKPVHPHTSNSTSTSTKHIYFQHQIQQKSYPISSTKQRCSTSFTKNKKQYSNQSTNNTCKKHIFTNPLTPTTTNTTTTNQQIKEKLQFQGHHYDNKRLQGLQGLQQQQVRQLRKYDEEQDCRSGSCSQSEILLRRRNSTAPSFSSSASQIITTHHSLPPRWKQQSMCHICRVYFSLIRRRHHCRNCGYSTCSKHSTQRIALPIFGIQSLARVCDVCFSSLLEER